MFPAVSVATPKALANLAAEPVPLALPGEPARPANVKKYKPVTDSVITI